VFNLSSLKDHLVSAAAGAALLGGGATIITNKVDLAANNQKIESLQVIAEDIRDIKGDVQRTKTDVAVIRVTVGNNHRAAQEVLETLE